MKDLLRPFEVHGVVFSGTSGDQAIGWCPFTERDDKFYVNTKTGLWDSKTAGLAGNLSTFLGEISKVYARAFKSSRRRRLAADRKLPETFFTDLGIGWNGSAYTLPIKDSRGRVQDIRMYRPGGKTISTAGCKTGLLGLAEMAKEPSSTAPVYIAEGEWDAIALRGLLASTEQPGSVVGVPGAAVFKEEWVEAFRGRTVVCCYDHDEAGRAGEEKATKRLRYVARQLRYVHWPADNEEGFDLRDWVSYGTVTKKVPKKCFAVLQSLIKDKPRFLADTEPTDSGEEERKTAWKTPATFQDVVRTFRKWLHLENTYAIEMMLAVAVSNHIDGDPLWMFLVAPPGGAKTETVSALALHPDVYMTSSLTPRALISGSSLRNGGDPSLIPKLNGKLLVVKDFTSILSMRDTDKDEIFGILRDAYDGKCGKEFGNGISRFYESTFTVLAGVTPKIYEIAQQHQSLGERFLKICVGDNLVHHQEEDIIARSIGNLNREPKMRWELQDVVQSFLGNQIANPRLPQLSKEMIRRLIALSKFGARLRGTVSRDVYRNEVMTSRPSAEVGSRLGKQLAKLGKSLALLHSRDQVNDDDYNLLKKVILDTVPQRTEDIVRVLHKSCPTVDDSLSTRDISVKTRYPLTTVQRVLADMHLLDIVRRAGTAISYEWTLSDYIRGCIADAQLYKRKEETERKGPSVYVRVLKKAKRSTHVK